MTALHMEAAYRERYDQVEPRAVFEFVSLDRDYGGSILSCLKAARENARAVRGSLTSELWVTLNSTWLDARTIASRRAPNADIGQFVEWVKERSHLTRGVTIGTILRDEAFHFTRIGTFLRKTSMDELPQLINVLRGEMSLVGPRPERPLHVDRLSAEIPHYLPRHLVKPGMTGWAQVNGLRGECSIAQRIQHDIYYIENWSLWLDVKIILRTIPNLLKGSG